MKQFGIYLSYPPTVDLRDQGLGRYLASLLKGIEELDNVKFTIVCPSWSHDSLEQLFQSESVSKEKFDIISPKKIPFSLRFYLKLSEAKPKYPVQKLRYKIRNKIIGIVRERYSRLEQQAVQIHDLKGVLLISMKLLMYLALFVILAPFFVFMLILRKIQIVFKKAAYKFIDFSRISFLIAFIKNVIANPKDDGYVLRLFKAMQESENIRMHDIIESLNNINSWYCPTVFWPEFNNIKASRLICVPDVVMSDFPVGFSRKNSEALLQTFNSISETINAGEHFVTYSESTKWNTLVNKYNVESDRITVINHAPNTLNQWIDIQGLPDNNAASHSYAVELLFSAFKKATNKEYLEGFRNQDIKYIFYASQFRPNKNLMTLLRAYNRLLREHYIGHKLILTGRVDIAPEIEEFIEFNKLEKDVLFMPGLSVSELAACYKLADLAINPSLSEGGGPFTFTEAMSVGTPVLESKIEVALEWMTDNLIQKVSLFDPYDELDICKQVLWALSNLSELKDMQMELFNTLMERTWKDVALEHVQVLTDISSQVPEHE